MVEKTSRCRTSNVIVGSKIQIFLITLDNDFAVTPYAVWWKQLLRFSNGDDGSCIKTDFIRKIHIFLLFCPRIDMSPLHSIQVTQERNVIRVENHRSRIIINYRLSYLDNRRNWLSYHYLRYVYLALREVWKTNRFWLFFFFIQLKSTLPSNIRWYRHILNVVYCNFRNVPRVFNDKLCFIFSHLKSSILFSFCIGFNGFMSSNIVHPC